MFRPAANPYDDIVAKATDENQTSEDWGVLSTVWDKVNDDGPTGSRNCVAAIQKRLQHRNANVQLYSLTLADSLIMNCKVDLHREISSRAFMQTLTRIVQDRTTHDKVKKRTVQLLKNWSEQFKKDETLGLVEETYDQLKKSHRVEDPSTEQPSVPLSVLKQEEEDIQRAIAESEALARNQGRQGYSSGSTSQAAASNPYGGYAAQSSTSGATNFFTQADAKALPDIQPEQAASQPLGASTSGSGQTHGPSRVKALYDFEPQEDGELAFRKGDIIRVVNSAYEGWWKGELDGRVGIFPLTYIEIIPDPTPESIARDAETEAQVFAQSGSVDRLLAMLSAADAQGSSISDDDELMELYHQCILLRPKIVKLLDKYNQKQKDLSSLHDKFKIAKTAYDTMLEESYQRSNQTQSQYGQVAGGYPGQIPAPVNYGYTQPVQPQPSQYSGQQPQVPYANAVSPQPQHGTAPYNQGATGYLPAQVPQQGQPVQAQQAYGQAAPYQSQLGVGDGRTTSPLQQPQHGRTVSYTAMPQPGQPDPTMSGPPLQSAYYTPAQQSQQPQSIPCQGYPGVAANGYA